jgi:methylated-DNA-[protein]-cysteine S-methyltransferase
MEKIYYSMLTVPFIKNVFVASTTKGICMVDFHTSEKEFLKEAKESFSGEMIKDDKKNRKALSQIEKYLNGKLKRFDCALDFRGTPFQKKVWAQLMKIPYGETRSYGEIARAVGRPKAFRAVGNANGANPIPIIAPCHRVIESNGGLGGFGHGLPLKKRLLALEKAYGSGV